MYKFVSCFILTYLSRIKIYDAFSKSWQSASTRNPTGTAETGKVEKLFFFSQAKVKRILNIPSQKFGNAPRPNHKKRKIMKIKYFALNKKKLVSNDKNHCDSKLLRVAIRVVCVACRKWEG